MKKDLNTSVAEASEKVPLSEKLWYGAADLFGGGQATLMSLLLLVFFTDVIGINSFLAGLVIFLSKFWDAVSDPLCGVLSDNTRSKMGRRKPFMLVGGILIIPALAFLFAPVQNIGGQGIKTAFAAVAYLVYCTVSTISQVPYMSMSSDLSPDFRERNKANSLKLIFDMAAAALCYLIPARLFEALSAGELSQTAFYLIIVFGFGTFFSLPLVIASFKIKERSPYPEEKSVFRRKEWWDSLKIKSFQYHIIMYVAAFLCADIISALALYYAANCLDGVMFLGKQISTVYIIAPMMVMAGAMVPVCYKLMQKTTKQFAYRAGLPMYMIGGVLLAVYQPSWPPILVPVFAVIMGIGLGGAQMMPWLVFPDTVDVAELKLGYRPTGAFSGVMTFARKFCTAVAIQLVGLSLFLAGYKSSTAEETIVQPASVLIMIRILFAASIVILISLAIYASLKYKVNNEKLKKIRFYNDMAREGRLNELTEEQLQERQDLIKELA